MGSPDPAAAKFLHSVMVRLPVGISGPVSGRVSEIFIFSPGVVHKDDGA